MARINLYEDNAGGLYSHAEGEQIIWNVGMTGSRFDEDCRGMVEDGTGDWTIENYSADDILSHVGETNGPKLIATWRDGQVDILRNDYSNQVVAGAAGRAYLGLPPFRVGR